MNDPFLNLPPLLLIPLALALSLTTTGCQSIKDKVMPASMIKQEPTNIYNQGQLPEYIKRVVVMPIYYEFHEGEFLARLDDTFLAEINKTARFETVRVNRDDLQSLFGARQMSSVSMLPADFVEKLAQFYAVEAVLMVDLTHYDPYKPIAIGIRSKLVDLKNLQIIWAFDDVFDAGSPGIANSARSYHIAHNRNLYPLDNAQSVLQSPQRFSKYIAYVIFNSLPAR